MSTPLTLAGHLLDRLRDTYGARSDRKVERAQARLADLDPSDRQFIAEQILYAQLEGQRRQEGLLRSIHGELQRIGDLLETAQDGRGDDGEDEDEGDDAPAPTGLRPVRMSTPPAPVPTPEPDAEDDDQAAEPALVDTDDLEPDDDATDEVEDA